jgi:phage terminase large subunit-like protein
MKKKSFSADKATRYAERVLAGDVVAGPHVRNACRRHMDDLSLAHKRNLWYDTEASDRIIRFYESQLRLSDGQFAGRPFVLHESQEFQAGSIFGWKRKDGTRRFRRAYNEEAKGNGKTPFAAGIALYGLMADGEMGAEIYAAGATKDQATILFRDAVRMREQSAALIKRLKTSGGEGREFNLAYLMKKSFFRPISREARRTGSGPRPHFAMCDEIHEHPDRGVMQQLERGFKWRRQPLLFMITNSGVDRNSICWEEHEHAIKVAAGNPEAKDDDPHYLGEPLDDTTFSFVCGLDSGDDPLTDPSCWVKANPLLGVTITEEYLTEVVAQARAMPGKLNGILRLNFCRWTDSETAWLTRDVIEPMISDFNPADYHDKKVWVGIDLSQNKDITAKVCTAEDGFTSKGEAKYVAWLEAWTPRDTVAARSLRDKQPYELWVQQGFLQAPNGKSINYDQVAQALAEDLHDYEVVGVAYDRYAFKQFESACNELGLSVPFVEHPQGGIKKGKPTEDMMRQAQLENREPDGLWMPGSVRKTEDLLLEGRLRLKRNPVLISAIMSAMLDTDRWGNSWLAKERSVNKIDAAVALCMSVGLASAMSNAGEKKFQVMIFGR